MVFLFNLILGLVIGIIFSLIFNLHHSKKFFERIAVTSILSFAGAVLGQIIPGIQSIKGWSNFMNSGFNLIPSLAGAVLLAFIAVMALNTAEI